MKLNVIRDFPRHAVCKKFASGLTYAQNLCCGAPKPASAARGRSEINSARKSLI
jgi:hypothetical protein